MHLAVLLSTATGNALLIIAVLVGLPLFTAAVLLAHTRGHSKGGPWWHSASMPQQTERYSGGSAAIGSRGKLVGGSRAPELSICQQCGAADPANRCAGCSCVAYCSRQCQQTHWKEGHKHECKKLRKQQSKAQQGGACASGSSIGAAADGKGSSSTERPEESNSSLPVPKQVLYPYEQYLKLAAAPPHRKQPLGLHNVGNSCYANSLLQSLIATPSLAAYLVSGEHGHGCLKPSPSDWCALCELEKLAQQAHHGGSEGGMLNPRPLLRNVKRLGKQFCFGKQEDSHELYLRLMEAVEAVQLLEASGKSKFDLRSRETTLIHHVFAGYTRGQIECLSCGHVSRTYECSISLTLEVSPRITSLEAALQRYTALERLDGDNRYKCDGCKAYVVAEKSTRLEVAPNTLQICLKRFGLGRYGKITSRLSFPEQLDLTPYMADGCLDRTPVHYSLYAVVVHIDRGRSTDHGHYIAYVRSGNSWFQCDDSTVTPVAASKALAAGAYLLFYQRQTPRQIPTAGDSRQQAAAAATPTSPSAHGSTGSHAGHNHQESMLRVETAPASLPHLAVASEAEAGMGSCDLSPGSSMDLQQQRQEKEQQQDISIGMPERLHSSASDGDLPSARRSEPAAGSSAGSSRNGSPRAADEGPQGTAAPAQQQPPPRAGGSGARRQSEEQQQGLQAAAADAAAAAKAEVAALLQQREDQQQLDDSDAASSASSSSTNFAPRRNPFDLLEREDGGRENSGSSDDEQPVHAARAVCEAVLPDKQPASSGRCQQADATQHPQPGDSKPAAAAPGAAAAVSAAASAAGVSAGSTAPVPAEPTAERQPASSGWRQRASAEQHPPDPSSKLVGAAAAKSMVAAKTNGMADAAPTRQAEQQPVSGRQRKQAAPKQRQAAGIPEAAAAASSARTTTTGRTKQVQLTAATQPDLHQTTSAGGLRQQQPASGGDPSSSQQQQSAGQLTGAAQTPKHRASVSSQGGGKRVLRLSVELPGVQEEGQVDWKLAAAGGSPQLLMLRAEQYSLRLPLPVTVAPEASAAKWAASRQELTVTWPVLP